MIVSDQYASHCCIVKQEPDGLSDCPRFHYCPPMAMRCPSKQAGVSEVIRSVAAVDSLAGVVDVREAKAGVAYRQRGMWQDAHFQA
jgi:hypothetical protein